MVFKHIFVFLTETGLLLVYKPFRAFLSSAFVADSLVKGQFLSSIIHSFPLHILTASPL